MEFDLLMLLADGDLSWKEWAIRLIAEYSYVGVFFFLIACGLGFPSPEEVALIGGGYAVHQAGGGLDAVLLMITVAMAGVLIGDVILWYLGRKVGENPEKLPMIGRHLSPERMAKGRAMFEEHGAKAVFFGRFLFGVRAVTFFVAGSMRVPLALFLIMDGLAALLSVPISVYLAWRFGDHLSYALDRAGEFHQFVLLGVGLLFVLAVVLAWRKHKRKVAAKGEALPVADAALAAADASLAADAPSAGAVPPAE